MIPGAYVLTSELTIDGELHADVSQNIYTATVEETVAGLYCCELTLLNHGEDGYFYFDRNDFGFGSEIRFDIVIGAANQPLFQGYIMGLEAVYLEGCGSRLTILAEDKLQDLRMTRRTRTFEDVSDADVMEILAQEHSLQPAFESLSGPSYPLIAQTNLSDLAFLRQCARRLNAELWLDGSTLHIAPRAVRGTERVSIGYGAGLRSFEVRADLAHQCTECIVSGWDPSSKEAIREQADDSSVSGELNGQMSGGAILQDAFGPRPHAVVHTIPLSSAEAQAVAEARYRERARQFVCGSGVADGDPLIRVGTTLELLQLGQMFDGEYYVTRACHTYGIENGYETEFEVARTWIG